MTLLQRRPDVGGDLRGIHSGAATAGLRPGADSRLPAAGRRRARYRWLAVGETVFLLIRHAESTWNAAGRWQGQADPPLSELGRRQALQLARELAVEPVDCVIASDLARANETAAILAEVWGLGARLDPRLRELDVGAWAGLTREQIVWGRRFDRTYFTAPSTDWR